MKQTKDEMIASIQSMDIADEAKMKLLEDVADSFGEVVDMTAYVAKEAYDELKNKYIQRFSEGAAAAPEVKEDPEPEPEKNPNDLTIADLFEEVGA